MRKLLLLTLFIGCQRLGLSEAFPQGGAQIGGQAISLKSGPDAIKIDTLSGKVLLGVVASNAVATNVPLISSQNSKQGAIPNEAIPSKTPGEQGISPADGNWRMRVDKLIVDGFISTGQERYWKSGVAGKGVKTQEFWSIIIMGVDTNTLTAGGWWKKPGKKKIIYDRIVKDNATGKAYLVYNVVALPQPSEQPSTPGSRPTGFREARPAGHDDDTFAAESKKSMTHPTGFSIETISADKIKATEPGELNVENVAVEILATGTNKPTTLHGLYPVDQ